MVGVFIKGMEMPRNCYNCWLGHECPKYETLLWNEINKERKADCPLIPAADVVQVVRCRDCACCIREDDYALWCSYHGYPMGLVPADGFCHNGRRREE